MHRFRGMVQWSSFYRMHHQYWNPQIDMSLEMRSKSAVLSVNKQTWVGRSRRNHFWASKSDKIRFWFFNSTHHLFHSALKLSIIKIIFSSFEIFRKIFTCMSSIFILRLVKLALAVSALVNRFEIFRLISLVLLKSLALFLSVHY